jgi:hypothetical protein
VSRTELHINRFYNDKTIIPPLDEEGWIMWKLEYSLITHKEAVLAIAEWRRDQAREVLAAKPKRATYPVRS